METIRAYKVIFDGIELPNCGFYNKSYFGNYEEAKNAVEQAWKNRLDELAKCGHEVIHEYTFEDNVLGYHHQIVLVYKGGSARIVNLRISKSRISLL